MIRVMLACRETPFSRIFHSEAIAVDLQQGNFLRDLLGMNLNEAFCKVVEHSHFDLSSRSSCDAWSYETISSVTRYAYTRDLMVVHYHSDRRIWLVHREGYKTIPLDEYLVLEALRGDF